jgi:stage II sporulation protein GA (sporulation sigma-E factor processing peptidase)
MYVYGDILLLVNTVMNGLILGLTAWAAGIACKVWRLLSAAFLGSLYALGGLVAADTLLYILPAKLLVAALLVIAAFGRRPLRSLILLTAYFYIISLFLGGAVLGWLLLAAPGDAGWPQVSAWHLAVGAAVAIGLAMLVGRRLFAGLGRRRLLLPVVVGLGSREVRLTGLVDTGNSLYTVGGRRPVVLIESEAVEPLFSSALREYLQATPADRWIAEIAACGDPGWLGRLQVIPCRGASGQGLLLGFRPDHLTLVTATGETTADAVVAIHAGRLDAAGGYAALLHPLVLQGLEAKEGTNICA